MTLITYLSYNDTYHTVVLQTNSLEAFERIDSFEMAYLTDRIQGLWIEDK